jgi:hypothetical protein
MGPLEGPAADRVPTLVISGRHDEMNPEDMRREGKLLPNSRVVLCEKGSHLAMWDDQEAYFRACSMDQGRRGREHLEEGLTPVSRDDEGVEVDLASPEFKADPYPPSRACRRRRRSAA